MDIEEAGIDFIIEEETGGQAYYEQVYGSTFVWPGKASGPTTGIGIDCAYYTEAELTKYFSPYVTPAELVRIIGAIGQKGMAGKLYTRKLKDIKISWDAAEEIYLTYTLPKFIKITERAFPGVNELCSNAQAAMLSLIFNRGAAMQGPTRVEMKNIRDLIPKKNYKAIAKQIRSMKRLWSSGGLPGRREREAKMVETCI